MEIGINEANHHAYCQRAKDEQGTYLPSLLPIQVEYLTDDTNE